MRRNQNTTYKKIFGLCLLAFFFVIIGNSNAKANNVISATDSIEIVKNFDTPAKYEGGTQALYNFLKEEIKYPKGEASGIIYVKCTINSNGKAIDYSIIQGINESIDKATIKAFWKLDKWIPAEKDGIKVASYIVVPLELDSK